jgi:hypothetical protein
MRDPDSPEGRGLFSHESRRHREGEHPMSKFKTAPMKDGIRYDDRGQPGLHMHSWKWAAPEGWYFCLGCGLRQGIGASEGRMVNDLYGDIAHDLRTYASHDSSCAFQGAMGPACDCGFDEVLERYDRLCAEAALAIPEEERGIDVERLAQAMVVSGLMKRYTDYANTIPTMTHGNETQMSREWAEVIAREYAALGVSRG